MRFFVKQRANPVLKEAVDLRAKVKAANEDLLEHLTDHIKTIKKQERQCAFLRHEPKQN